MFQRSSILSANTLVTCWKMTKYSWFAIFLLLCQYGSRPTHACSRGSTCSHRLSISIVAAVYSIVLAASQTISAIEQLLALGWTLLNDQERLQTNQEYFVIFQQVSRVLFEIIENCLEHTNSFEFNKKETVGIFLQMCLRTKIFFWPVLLLIQSLYSLYNTLVLSLV